MPQTGFSELSSNVCMKRLLSLAKVWLGFRVSGALAAGAFRRWCTSPSIWDWSWSMPAECELLMWILVARSRMWVEAVGTLWAWGVW